MNIYIAIFSAFQFTGFYDMAKTVNIYEIQSVYNGNNVNVDVESPNSGVVADGNPVVTA